MWKGGVTDLEDAGVSTDSVSLDTGGWVFCAMSDDFSGLSEEELEPLLVATSGLKIDEWDDELALLDLLTLSLCVRSNGNSSK